ncbi:MAG TPA: peptide chain release factor 2 [Thermoanaerobaculia bacterium]|nr:peptide chain release factor 2 [Thermoanaerobaculia bacterium]
MTPSNEERVERLLELASTVRTLRGYLDLARAEREKTELEKKAGDPAFWSDNVTAQETLRKLKRAENVLADERTLKEKQEELEILAEFLRSGEPVERDVDAALVTIGAFAREKELTFKLTDVEDTMPAILEIHAGQGGTEAQDWAEMLLRMYLRWAERREFQVEMAEASPGEEAGIKSASFIARGENAYGLFAAERGVHRLVRISPFDAAARRHTSFASVHVSPEIDDSIEVDINDKDLKVDTFRAGGKGGQHVNKTESAIRITHLPTGIVVQCQNERSQHKNRDFAMKVLRSRLYQKAVEERRAKDNARAGAKMEIGFGSQIRSYVLAPYRLVKDHRTGFEMGDVDRVLDGDLDGFVEAYLQSFSKHGEKVRTRQGAASLPGEDSA